MYIQNRIFSISYKFILVVFGILGLLLNFGVFSSSLDLKGLITFSVLSNLLCIVYFTSDLLYLIKNIHDKNKTTWKPALKGIATISITLLLGWHLTGEKITLSTAFGVSMILVHDIVPIMTILDWLLFDKKGYVKKASPIVWPLGPLSYFVVMVAAQMCGIHQPYPFIDVELLGYGKVFLGVIVIFFFFVTIGYILFAVERIFIKIDGKNKSR